MEKPKYTKFISLATACLLLAQCGQGDGNKMKIISSEVACNPNPQPDKNGLIPLVIFTHTLENRTVETNPGYYLALGESPYVVPGVTGKTVEGKTDVNGEKELDGNSTEVTIDIYAGTCKSE